MLENNGFWPIYNQLNAEIAFCRHIISMQILPRKRAKIKSQKKNNFIPN